MLNKITNGLGTLILLPGIAGISPAAGAGEIDNGLFEMSLEQLLQVPVYSASKNLEPVWNSPASISVLTREQIIASGAGQIPELLRLLPGVIVREQTNGAFDVHIRGFDNVPPGARFSQTASSQVLLMIDNRPVFDYFNGGTFWESLPVHVRDIERIELVRGPSSALFGPNAVTGTINIFTRQQSEAFEGYVAAGSQNSLDAHIKTQLEISNNSSLMLSAFTQQGDRYQDTYWSWVDSAYVERDDIRSAAQGGIVPANIAVRYPDPNLAFDKTSATLDFKWQKENRQWRLSAGYQDSEVQKIYIETQITPFTTSLNQSHFINSELQVSDFTWRASFNHGDHSELGIPDIAYHYEQVDTSVDYRWQIGNWRVQPEISFRRNMYDGVFIGGEQDISNTAVSLRTTYKPDSNLWVNAAIRHERFDVPDSNETSWQLTGVYQVSETQQWRLTNARANRAAFFVDSFLDLILNVPNSNLRIEFDGNKFLDLQQTDAWEIGYKYANREWSIEVEAFQQEADNFTDILTFTPFLDGSTTVVPQAYANLPLVVTQQGVSTHFRWQIVSDKQLQVHLTLQDSELDDHTPDISQPGQLIDIEHEATPRWYGGISYDWQFNDNWFWHIDAYYMDDSEFQHLLSDGSAEDIQVSNIETQWVFNTRLNWQFSEHSQLTLNWRNMLANKRQFAYADTIEDSANLAISFQF